MARGSPHKLELRAVQTTLESKDRCVVVPRTHRSRNVLLIAVNDTHMPQGLNAVAGAFM